MRSRSHKYLAALALLPLAAGCVQATRHSNTMVFGTNTTVGFKVGQGVNQVPQIMLAYDRQEAVIMPLVANTRDEKAADGSRLLVPCDFTTPSTLPGNIGYRIHPCSLVAWDGKKQDSYSVLASFGADFGGQVDSTQAKAKAGLAQYFATGIAAQILAARGGAALVSTGPAAMAATLTADDALVQTLLDNPEAADQGVSLGRGYNAFRDSLLLKISNTESGLQAKVKNFEARAGLADGLLSASCSAKGSCLKAVEDNSGSLAASYFGSAEGMDSALQKWDEAAGGN
jgi:hypothetical protein